MKVADLTFPQVARSLGGSGLALRMGPFLVRVSTTIPPLVQIVYDLLRDYRVANEDPFCDFHVSVSPASVLRRRVRPQIRFLVDGRPPFEPLPARHYLPALEWGINWCIAARCHHLLMLHAAVVEREGRAILFPAWPGHGKSTLCAALVHSGWRLLSDEFGLVRPSDGAMVPLPRLMPLKNESIEVIRRFAPHARIGPSFEGTRKGTIAHVCPPASSVDRASETAAHGWLVFPRWAAGSPLRLEPMAKARAFLMVATNAFNYEVLGETSFRLVGDMVRTCDCYSLTYSDLREAVHALDELTRAAHG